MLLNLIPQTGTEYPGKAGEEPKNIPQVGENRPRTNGTEAPKLSYLEA